MHRATMSKDDVTRPKSRLLEEIGEREVYTGDLHK